MMSRVGAWFQRFINREVKVTLLFNRKKFNCKKKMPKRKSEEKQTTTKPACKLPTLKPKPKPKLKSTLQSGTVPQILGPLPHLTPKPSLQKKICKPKISATTSYVTATITPTTSNTTTITTPYAAGRNIRIDISANTENVKQLPADLNCRELEELTSKINSATVKKSNDSRCICQPSKKKKNITAKRNSSISSCSSGTSNSSNDIMKSMDCSMLQILEEMAVKKNNQQNPFNYQIKSVYKVADENTQPVQQNVDINTLLKYSKEEKSAVYVITYMTVKNKEEFLRRLVNNDPIAIDTLQKFHLKNTPRELMNNISLVENGIKIVPPNGTPAKSAKNKKSSATSTKNTTKRPTKAPIAQDSNIRKKCIPSNADTGRILVSKENKRAPKTSISARDKKKLRVIEESENNSDVDM